MVCLGQKSFKNISAKTILKFQRIRKNYTDGIFSQEWNNLHVLKAECETPQGTSCLWVTEAYQWGQIRSRSMKIKGGRSRSGGWRTHSSWPEEGKKSDNIFLIKKGRNSGRIERKKLIHRNWTRKPGVRKNRKSTRDEKPDA